ncbi:P-loop containing nucleoside triphosphate hydrolase protein [Pavlovales sp. CCMP2436]|nr:P-loop containing nucleoside triphosphate hydrolase protein [Pavlovales sp. CCMP2436]
MTHRDSSWRLTVLKVVLVNSSLDRATLDATHESAGNKRRLLMSAEVVCCTLSGAGADTLTQLALGESGRESGSAAQKSGSAVGKSGKGGAAGLSAGKAVPSVRFPLLVVDEAAQAVELSTLIPFRLGVQHAVLVGDPKQLPATVLSTEAASCLYAEGLFHRCLRAGLQPYMLTVQYRMHPHISRFPAGLFYDGQLTDGVSAEQRTTCWHTSAAGALGPFTVHDVEMGKELGGAGGGSSLRNEAEAAHVAKLLLSLGVHAPSLLSRPTPASKRGGGAGQSGQGSAGLGGAAGQTGGGGGSLGGEGASVAVLAPYKEQVSALRRAASSALGAAVLQGLLDAGLLEFSTVDGFQGREVDFLIYSATRASGLGFVADVRRLNVALTRARQSLVVVGHAATLVRNGTFKKLLESARGSGTLFNAAEALGRCARQPQPQQHPYPQQPQQPQPLASAGGLARGALDALLAPHGPAAAVAGKRAQRPSDEAIAAGGGAREEHVHLGKKVRPAQRSEPLHSKMKRWDG